MHMKDTQNSDDVWMIHGNFTASHPLSLSIFTDSWIDGGISFFIVSMPLQPQKDEVKHVILRYQTGGQKR